jgi:hypothetical protein
MSGGGKTSWRDLAVHSPASEALGAPERLAALYRFQTGEAPPGLSVSVGSAGDVEVIGDPADVDWAGFPELLALEAVTREELRRLRSLLRADLSMPPEELPTPPRGFDWSAYLGNISVSPTSEC